MRQPADSGRERGRVSVTMPAYNAAASIGRAVRSVLGQTYQNWELIVVDDGSTDATPAVLKEFVDARIEVIQQTNQGLARSRNTAIAQSSGEFLAFLDADDEWTPEFLSRCIETIRADKTLAALYTHHRYIDGEGRLLPQSSAVTVAAESTRSRLRRGGFFPPCAVVARYDAVAEAGGFDEGLDGRGAEDWDLWLGIAERGRFGCLPEALARYRVSEGSMSSDATGMHACRMSVIRKRFGELKDGEPAPSKEQREAFAFALRDLGLALMLQGEEETGWERVGEAAAVWPDILTLLETQYEFVCANQPRGWRGDAKKLDLDERATAVVARLGAIFAIAQADVRSVERIAIAKTHVALALLSEQAGRRGTARRHLGRAVRLDPGLLRERGMARRLGTLLLPALAVQFGRKRRRPGSPAVTEA